jgi:hypothetical protein
MTDVNLNMSHETLGLTRAAEQGWLTGEAWAMLNHEPKLSGSTANHVLPSGRDTSVNNIRQYECMFTYATMPQFTVSRTGRSGDSSTVGFTVFNGMDTNRKCAFLGVTTTEYIQGTGVNAKVGVTMSGVVTTDCTSYESFKVGDFVGWKVPSMNKDATQVFYPFNRHDSPINRYRCVLYPIRGTGSNHTRRVIMAAIREATNSITALMTTDSSMRAVDAALHRLQQVDKSSITVTHLRNVLDTDKENWILDSEHTASCLGQDMWAILEHVQRQDSAVPRSGRGGHVNVQTALSMVVVAYLAVTAVIREVYKNNGKVRSSKQTVKGDQASLVLMNLEADCLSRVLAFGASAHEILVDQKRQVIGMCQRSCSAGAVSGLDIWLGRKD